MNEPGHRTNEPESVFDAEANLIETFARQIGGGTDDDYLIARALTRSISALMKAHLAALERVGEKP